MRSSTNAPAGQFVKARVLAPGLSSSQRDSMNWEHQVIKADSAETFQSSLNKLGAEGWEAISGTYTIGEQKKVTLGHGMAPTTAAGTPMWVAIMKRAIAA